MKLVMAVLGAILFTSFVLFLFRASPDVTTGRYPDQAFYHKYSASSTSYNIVIVADMDKASKFDDHWKSSLIYGTLERDTLTGKYSIGWQNERVLQSKMNEGGRSMELSDLCNFGDRLYSFDDRTGMVIVIEEDVAYPVALLMDGNGRSEKGFKAEWCTVKDGELFVGGMGKEWTDAEGNFINNNPLWVKTIQPNGVVAHNDWISRYNALKDAAGAKTPGYILNESGLWLPEAQRWVFLPRRVSKEKYDAVKDEFRCSNIGLLATEDFGEIRLVPDVGPLNRSRGFSSAKFIPWRENEIVVLKTEEVEETNTYIMIYDMLSKKVLLEETLIGYHMKFEGIEFI